MTRVVVVDGDPVEPRSKIVFDLSHEIAGEGAQVLHLDSILWRDDEAELMPIATTALDERPALVAVTTVLECGIDPALLAVARNPVSARDSANAHRPPWLRRHAASGRVRHAMRQI